MLGDNGGFYMLAEMCAGALQCFAIIYFLGGG
jgi:hypothetical protein